MQSSQNHFTCSPALGHKVLFKKKSYTNGITSTALYWHRTIYISVVMTFQINVIDDEIWQRCFGAYSSSPTCFILHKWNRALRLPSKTLAPHNTCKRLERIHFRSHTSLRCALHSPLNETKRFIMQPAFRMYGSCLISPDSDWGVRTEFPEGCRARVRSDILQSDVSGSMLWACSITWCLSVILPCCSAACTCLSSAGEQWAAPAAQYDESYLCKHAGCLSHGYRKTRNYFSAGSLSLFSSWFGRIRTYSER